MQPTGMNCEGQKYKSLSWRKRGACLLIGESPVKQVGAQNVAAFNTGTFTPVIISRIDSNEVSHQSLVYPRHLQTHKHLPLPQRIDYLLISVEILELLEELSLSAKDLTRIGSQHLFVCGCIKKAGDVDGGMVELRTTNLVLRLKLKACTLLHKSVGGKLVLLECGHWERSTRILSFKDLLVTTKVFILRFIEIYNLLSPAMRQQLHLQLGIPIGQRAPRIWEDSAHHSDTSRQTLPPGSRLRRGGNALVLECRHNK